MEENTQPKSWWKRNWKWVVPTGGCLGLIVLFALFFGALFFGISSVLSDSQASIDAMEKVKANPDVIGILGEPIEQNGMTGGSFHTSNGYKTAEVTIPIKGPNGEATIRVEGEGVEDNWSYDKMLVYISDTDTVIDLLEEGSVMDEIEE